MNKKVVIPTAIAFVITTLALLICCTGNNKVILSGGVNEVASKVEDSITLNVYVENSGSMDGYMCAGSNLKDAVFDYISDLKRLSTSCSLFYINSKVIPYPKDDLQSFIKDLTPQPFAQAGGNRSNTDLRCIFKNIVKKDMSNSVSVLVSDCILDIDNNAPSFLGQCEVSVKNTFKDALQSNTNLAVEIIQLESKFDGYWFCGHNKVKLDSIKRPYYIWIIGDQRCLTLFNEKVPVNEIIGGIKNYCAYVIPQPIPFGIGKNKYSINHLGKIKVQLQANLKGSLQPDDIIGDITCYRSGNPQQVIINGVHKIEVPGNKYSHVIELEITNPKTIKQECISFNYPSIPKWVAESNDDTGTNIKGNINKTTGLKALVKGVADAYRNNTTYGTIKFDIK